MTSIRKKLTGFLAVAVLLTWVTYPGWFNEYYFIWPEKYAYPASFSNQCDPPWGFWFW
jgi:hypothetical protein